MKQMLLVTHGHFASGIRSSLEIIMGKQSNLATIDAYTGEQNFDEELESYLETIDVENDTVIILTDLFGGSVNQKIATKLQGENIHIVTGLNLPLLLELSMLSKESITKEEIIRLVNNSKEQIQYVEQELKAATDDFDF